MQHEAAVYDDIILDTHSALKTKVVCSECMIEVGKFCDLDQLLAHNDRDNACSVSNHTGLPYSHNESHPPPLRPSFFTNKRKSCRHFKESDSGEAWVKMQ